MAAEVAAADRALAESAVPVVRIGISRGDKTMTVTVGFALMGPAEGLHHIPYATLHRNSPLSWGNLQAIFQQLHHRCLGAIRQKFPDGRFKRFACGDVRST
ncbi:hypothetical protein [Burkholderia sp. Nafp2/4-1b]|uniref:hypothetical protein n=1 Tax=Burkholderia sp. Nafp2/4-1b TaxID=2116686 RepID=UPI000EF9505B|nr:hypothetical protein [Burkholderia sp. Nafp2/4-1b]